MKLALNRPEVIAKRNLPKNKIKHRKAIKKALNKPEIKIKISMMSKKAMNRSDIKQKHKKATKDALNRPEIKAKMIESSCGRIWICNFKQNKFIKIHQLQKYLNMGYHRGRNKSDNLGGFREFNGKKSGYYKDILFQSSWELAFIIYHLEHKIQFKRNYRYFLYTFENKICKYYPDFIKFNKYVEVKGFISKKTIAKIQQFPKTEQLEVLYYNDIKPYLNYCTHKYGKDFLNLLKDKVLSN